MISIHDQYASSKNKRFAVGGFATSSFGPTASPALKCDHLPQCSGRMEPLTRPYCEPRRSFVNLERGRSTIKRLNFRAHRLWIPCILMTGLAAAVHAQTATVAGELYAEPPTLISLGF